MARRSGRRGDYLYTDDYTDFPVFGSRVRPDFWNDYTAGKRLERNLQEIAKPLNDPYPVPLYSGPSYEQTSDCIGELSPLFIGKTNRPFPNGSPASQALNLDPGVGTMSVSCTFIVR